MTTFNNENGRVVRDDTEFECLCDALLKQSAITQLATVL